MAKTIWEISKRTNKRPSEVVELQSSPFYKYLFDVQFYNRFLNEDEYKKENLPKADEIVECDDELELLKKLGIPVDE